MKRHTTYRLSTLLSIAITVLFSACGYTTRGILEQPEPVDGCEVIKHKAYSLQYNEEKEQAYWVAWELNAQELTGSESRTNKFLEDPKVKTGTATDADYYKSGYDRGHLAPAADMAFDKQAMSESFYYSNMSPQNPSFNRGIWKKLEEKTREWARTYNQIYVVAGSLYLSDCKYIGENKVAVPTHFYRTILVVNDSIQQAIGFVLPNEKSKKPIFDYALSIDSIEKISGFDFYPALRNRYEKKIEAQFNLQYWK